MDAKANTFADDQALGALKRELEDLEAQVAATKKLIQEREGSITRSKQEVENLKSELKIEFEELRSLSRQVVTGEDQDDEAIIADADRVRANVVRVIEEYLSM